MPTAFNSSCLNVVDDPVKLSARRVNIPVTTSPSISVAVSFICTSTTVRPSIATSRLSIPIKVKINVASAGIPAKEYFPSIFVVVPR